MLTMTKIELELISDTDVHFFVETGMRGAFSYIAKRYSKANKNTWNHAILINQVSTLYILIANNIFYLARIQYLHFGRYKWLSQNEIDKFDVNSISEDSSDGCILVVDLKYPAEFHYLHNG